MTKTKREIELEEKLGIAVEAFNEIRELPFDKYSLKEGGYLTVFVMKDIAKQALKEITFCRRQQNDDQIVNANKKVGE